MIVMAEVCPLRRQLQQCDGFALCRQGKGEET